MKLQLDFSREFKEYKFTDGVIWLAGTLFNDVNIITDESLASFIVENIKNKRIKEQNLNGFFSFCYINDKEVVIGTDHLRTKAIFYKIDNETIAISDLAERLLTQKDRDNVNKDALSQFKSTGYVFGNETLFKGINYTQGGTVFYINRENKETISETFFSFDHHRKEYSWEELKDNYDKVIDAIFDRFIRYANGRQIVVPLSAGHDSLLTVSVLKKKGYSNVLAFTYGKKGNKEALVSKQVAENLGFKWEFVEYTKEKWIKEWEENKIEYFTSYTMNLHCLPHIQDYIAVKELKENKIVEKNAIFAPGHCPAGVHFPKTAFYKDIHTQKELVDFILHYHFVNDISIVNKNKSVFEEYVDNFSKKNNFRGSSDSFADIVELWQWYEREPKYIVNSIRNYTFFGYDYWMPLWDIEHAKFWINMSFDIAGDRKWFEWYIENYYKRLIGEKEKLEFKPTKKSPKEHILKNTLLGDFLKRFLCFLKTKKHPLLFDAIYSNKEYFIEIVLKGNHLLNGYADKFLKIVFKV